MSPAMGVLSFVSASIAPERHDEIKTQYEAMVGRGLPPPIRSTYLLIGEDGEVAIATLWRSRADLEAMMATDEEPFARRVLREAGGEPAARFFDVVAEG